MTDADDWQLLAVVEIVVQTLGDAIVGVYRYGSAVMGGLRPHSDIDVFVLVRRPTTSHERRDLLQGIMPISGRRATRIPGRPVELTVARLDELVPWRESPTREFQYGEWLRGEYEAGLVPAPALDPDLAPLVATLLTASRSLLGPLAGDLLDPVPHTRLLASMQQAIPALLDELEDDTTNVLLTLARMAYTTRFGSITSKDEAARWAVDELPSTLSAPVAVARRIYLGQAEPSAPISVDPATSAAAQRLGAMVNNGESP